MHVAEADVFGAAVDLQRRRLLCWGADQQAVAPRDERLLLGVAGLSAVARRGTGSRADILSLVAKTAGALSDAETAGFAEIILPGIEAGQLVGLALPERLRTGEGRGLFQRKADLRIGSEVDAAGLFAKTAVGDDVAARAIAEIGRPRRRPLGDLGGNIRSRPRGQAAGDAQRSEEALGDRVGLAGGPAPGPRGQG